MINIKLINQFSHWALISFFIIFFSMLKSCSEPCDGDSFFEWLGFSFIILDEDTHENLFSTSHPNYNYSDFRVYDLEGNEYEKDYTQIFPNNDNTGNERSNALSHPITKYYYLRFNDYDQDTLKVVVKGNYSDPCAYEITEYIKIFYNDKVVYYNLFPENALYDDTIKLYKKI